ncbi:hypothetical protein B0O99DRAFT_615963 [Bisporella sp. PMI_857]|nr:hypothetical protein B0O99DRAFT_615963 [Bisporella sp. PMI_857]
MWVLFFVLFAPRAVFGMCLSWSDARDARQGLFDFRHHHFVLCRLTADEVVNTVSRVRDNLATRRYSWHRMLFVRTIHAS